MALFLYVPLKGNIAYKDTGSIRAAMIVFLLMQEKQNG
ncbi:hypothetical protein AKN40_2512 [Escherichia coli]|nr:hypothetical protein AKN40_2512 [Escherichia coli]EGV45349.1 hypothetical protein IAM_22318 [Escherichia coli XH001]